MILTRYCSPWFYSSLSCTTSSKKCRCTLAWRRRRLCEGGETWSPNASRWPRGRPVPRAQKGRGEWPPQPFVELDSNCLKLPIMNSNAQLMSLTLMIEKSHTITTQLHIMIILLTLKENGRVDRIRQPEPRHLELPSWRNSEQADWLRSGTDAVLGKRSSFVMFQASSWMHNSASVQLTVMPSLLLFIVHIYSIYWISFCTPH